MEFMVGIAQTCHPVDGDVVSLVDRFAADAQAKGVELLVFPESLMSRYEAEIGDFLAESQPIDGLFARAVNAIAAKRQLWIVYTMNELNPNAKPFNTAIAVDAEGVVRGVYRKVHLFDSATTTESERMAASDALFDPVQTPFGKLGMAICYDLRFPEQARAAALAGADIMLYPAAWVDGLRKVDQWRALLKARAIENEFFVAGLSRCDRAFGEVRRDYAGHSCVYGPLGDELASAGLEEQLLIADIDLSEIAKARAAMPVLDHRRSSVY